MPSYVFDIETNGLLEEVSEVHCIVLKDIDTGNVITEDNNTAINLLSKADVIIGHNIIKYDIPVLEKIYKFQTRAKVFDTLVATRLLFPDVRDQDFKRKNFPTQLIGRHSLVAWGTRIGEYKQSIETDWKTFTPEMLEYCVQDVLVTEELYKVIESKNYSQQSMELEHDVASLIFKQEQHGFSFDVNKARSLYSILNERRLKIEQELQNIFPPITTKRISEKTGKTLKDKVTLFNPSSRLHIAARLKEKYNWQPTEFTSDGRAKVDDTILSTLSYPEAKVLAEHFLLDKRLGQLATGNQAWLKVERNGKIYGTCNTNSTVTARASHSFPNLGQVPSVNAIYGHECRELFTVEKDKKLVGIDISGLEVRMLAHFMSKYDNGEYTKVVLEGDIHTNTQELAGLDSRNISKVFFYAFLYGSGVKKLAQITGKKVSETSKIKKRFLNNLPALNKLITQVGKVAESGWITALDKRKIKVRSPHAALNTLLQSAGSIVSKKWLIEFDKEIKKFKNAQQVVWVHDEIQVECEEQDAEDIGKIAVECIKRTGEYFKLRIPLTGEYKIGNNWSETH